MISEKRSALQAQNFGAPVLAVCGFSGSGKTTLIEAAIPHLIERGLSVAVVKHDAHGFVVDKAGKDSDRFFRAGATVALRGPGEQFFRRSGAQLLTLEAILTDLARDHDLLLVEGHKDTPLPKLWVGNAEGSAPPDQVTMVQEILPWDSDRLKCLLEWIDRWLPEAWRLRPLYAGLLVGGKSSRMGSPKQLLNFGGSTLGEIAAHALSNGIKEADAESDAQFNPNLVILGAGPLPDALQSLIRLPDTLGLAGPLAGLLAAHRWAPRAAWVLAACDHPWLNAAEIRWLVEQRRPGAWTILSRQSDDHPCPTLALYEPQALTVLERSLVSRGAERVRMAELFDHPHTVLAQQFTHATVNVNTPDDFAAALAKASSNHTE